MQFTAQTSADGIIERHFRLGEAPGVLWCPEDADDPRPLILIGHGGSQHKTAPSVRARARMAAGERPGAVRAFGSGEKTLHANPGRHREVPGFELDSSVRFFSGICPGRGSRRPNRAVDRRHGRARSQVMPATASGGA